MKDVKAQLGASGYARFQELLKALRCADSSPATVLNDLAALLCSANATLFLHLASFLPAEHKPLHAAQMRSLTAETGRPVAAAAPLPGLAPQHDANEHAGMISRKRFDRDVSAGKTCCMPDCAHASLVLPFRGSCGHAGCKTCWETSDYECGACGVVTRRPALVKRYFG